MGNNSISTATNDWVEVSQNKLYTIVRDKNGREGQLYQYQLPHQFDPSYQNTIFQLRNNLSPSIIKAYTFNCNFKGGNINPKNNMAIVTERIPWLLSDVPQLSFPESVYVLRRSLQGYKQLYEKQKDFVVNEKMIGFTPDGEAKVWFNQNFGSNHPSKVKGVLQTTTFNRNYLEDQYSDMNVSSNEAMTVRNIVETVQNKCENGKYPFQFSSKIKAPNVGFENAQKEIDAIIFQNSLIVPNRIDLLNNKIMVRNTYLISQPQSNKQSRINSLGLPNKNSFSAYTVLSSNSKIPYRNSNISFEYIKPIQKDHPCIFASRLVYR